MDGDVSGGSDQEEEVDEEPDSSTLLGVCKNLPDPAKEILCKNEPNPEDKGALIEACEIIPDDLRKLLPICPT